MTRLYGPTVRAYRCTDGVDFGVGYGGRTDGLRWTPPPRSPLHRGCCRFRDRAGSMTARRWCGGYGRDWREQGARIGVGNDDGGLDGVGFGRAATSGL